jgi:hypothetical protein
LVNQQHLLDLLQHLSYGIESSSSAVEGEKILNINELASRLNVSEDKLSRLLSSKNMTAEQVDNPAKEAQIARELNSGLATPTQSQPPAKPAQAPGGGLAKASAPVATSFPPARSASEVRARKDAATVNVLANPQDVVSEIMEESARRATERLAAKKEDKIQDLTERIVERAEAEINVTMDFFDQFMERGTQSTLKPFQVEMDDMGATIDVPVM